MTLTLNKSVVHPKTSIQITGSKSESNRLLLLQALYSEISIDNISNSDDSQLMQKAVLSDSDTIDIHHAGTAMRFLTAYFATKPNSEIVLTGSRRMKERPIQILVEALRTLGADIDYVENEGFPPLRIKGKELTQHKVSLKANVSSQYISALLLIASKLENGLELTLEGEITSVPYINMTLQLLSQIGVEASFENQVILVKPLSKENQPKNNLVVESDWSSASYFYSIVALSAIGTEVTLSSYKQDSLQGDSDLVNIYKSFGVSTSFSNNQITLKKEKNHLEGAFQYNLKNAPDIAQTISVTCFGLGIACDLTGLHTLKIKETDRLFALKTEIEKLGGIVDVTNDSLHLQPRDTIKKEVIIATYNDHRMAMAFAPLALKEVIKIEDEMVVTKSYPTFWDDLKTLGFSLFK